MEPADVLADVQSIKNRICDSLALSAFDQRDYLPLDQLFEILSPVVVHQLLLQHFAEDKVLDYEVEVLGSSGGKPPRRRRIFAILVMTDQVKRLSDFVDKNVDDRHLPLHFDNIENSKHAKRVSYIPYQEDVSRLTDFDVWPAHPAQDFMLWQWVINVPFLVFSLDRIYFYNLPRDSTLPFDYYNRQETGGYGTVYKATVHTSHYYCDKNLEGKRPRHFAVKKTHAPNEADFLREIEIFDKLSIENSSNHLIPLRLALKHGKDYYLVFPWADGNLKNFWGQRRANPQDPDEVRWFMAQCDGIARGLRKIHHSAEWLGEPTDARNIERIIMGGKEWGRHGGIKPENILWFEDYEGSRDHLAISDFGLTQFNSAHSHFKVHQDQTLGLSGTYRPPDLHLEDQLISQNYDVWSLGCVFLEFVSWFLLGHDETVMSFTVARLNDEREGNFSEDKFFIFEKDEQDPHGTSKKATLKKSVVEWIKKLHKNPRCTEPLHALLDLIQFTMLVPEPDDRWKCAWVESRLRRLSSKCKKDDFAINTTSQGPDPNRYLDFPEKTQTAVLSVGTSLEEARDIYLCPEHKNEVET